MKRLPESWSWLVLFTSLSTLLCCALPIVLVMFGMGAVVASLATHLPFLVYMSRYKIWTFVISGLILVLAGFVLARSGRSCPTDPELARRCVTAQRWNARIFWVSVIIWIIGFLAAYALLPVVEYFENTIAHVESGRAPLNRG